MSEGAETRQTGKTDISFNVTFYLLNIDNMGKVQDTLQTNM